MLASSMAQGVPVGIREAVALASYTTYQLGGSAQYFLETYSADKLARALRWATSLKLPLFVLGGGSNILVADSGFAGLVVHFKNSELRMHDDEVSVGAGLAVSELIDKTLAAGLVGMECMAGVPGEVGGAVRGNAGTFGQQIGDYVVDVTVVTRSGEQRTIPASQCDFSYRHSSFKQSGDIITSVRLKLEPGNGEAGVQLVNERLERRAKTQPAQPSAGCIFKNFRFDDIDLDALRAKGLDVDKFSEHRKLPAAYIIESAGLKGTRVGDIEVSSVHANFLVNHGAGTSAQVRELMEKIKQAVRERYELELQEEVQLVGF